MGIKNKNKTKYEFEGNFIISELLCDRCKHGLSGDCVASPACKAYEALEAVL